MKVSWMLTPVLLAVLAIGQASTDDRIATTPPHAGIPTLEQAYELERRAHASGRADELIAVGDLYRRIGEVTGSRALDARAHDSYAAALSRARRQESLDGVLRAAEAFAALGDRPAVERALGVALRLTADDPEARGDVQAFAARIATDMADDVSHPGR